MQYISSHSSMRFLMWSCCVDDVPICFFSFLQLLSASSCWVSFSPDQNDTCCILDKKGVTYYCFNVKLVLLSGTNSILYSLFIYCKFHCVQTGMWLKFHYINLINRFKLFVWFSCFVCWSYFWNPNRPGIRLMKCHSPLETGSWVWVGPQVGEYGA